MTTSVFGTGTSARVENLFQAISELTGVVFNFGLTKAFRVTLETNDGENVVVRPASLGAGVKQSASIVQGPSLAVPASGAPDMAGSEGTATLVASTVTVTVPTPEDGNVPVPVGSTVYATVTTEAGAAKRLSAVRASDTTITISSPGSGYAALLESAVAAETLVAGTVDVTLANLVGDRLVVALNVAAGTPGVLSVKRKSATEVTVQSWLDATGIQALDTSTVKVYNFGAAAHETSTVRYAVIQP